MPVPLSDTQGAEAPQTVDAPPPSFREAEMNGGSMLNDAEIESLCGAELKDRLREVRTELALAKQQHETSEKSTVEMVNQLLAELHRHEEQSSLVKNECKGLVADIDRSGQLRKAMQSRVSALTKDCSGLRSDIAEAQKQISSASKKSKEKEREQKRSREQALQRVQVAKSREQHTQDDVLRKRHELEELLTCQKELLEEANGCKAMCETYDKSASNLVETAQAAIQDADEAAKTIQDAHRDDLLQFHEQYAILQAQVKEVQSEAQRWLKEQQEVETKSKAAEAKVKNLEKRRAELRTKTEKITKDLQAQVKELEAAQMELKRKEAQAAAAAKKRTMMLFQLHLFWFLAVVILFGAMYLMVPKGAF